MLEEVKKKTKTIGKCYGSRTKNVDITDIYQGLVRIETKEKKLLIPIFRRKVALKFKVILVIT